MIEPILKFALNDSCWYVQREDPKEWVVCFTATYNKNLKKNKELLIWRIDSIGPDEKDRFMRELTRRAGAKRIVHLCIYRVIKPQTDAEIEEIKDCNRQLTAECKN